MLPSLRSDGGDLLLKKLVELFTGRASIGEGLHHQITVESYLSLPGHRRVDPSINTKKDRHMIVKAILRCHL
jgi:hypothetical protein